MSGRMCGSTSGVGRTTSHDRGRRLTEFTEPERERTNFHLRRWAEDVRTAHISLVLALGGKPQPSRAAQEARELNEVFGTAE